MSKSVLQEYSDAMFTKINVTCEARGRILAGVPQHGPMLEYFIKLKQMSKAEEEAFTVRIQDGKLTDEEKTEMEESSCCIFEPEPENKFLSIWHGNIKAMLRECCSVTGSFMSKRSSSAKGNIKASGKQNYQHALFIEPMHIVFLSNFEHNENNEKVYHGDSAKNAEWLPMLRPHGFADRVKIIQDAQGRRTALGRHAYLENVRFKFSLKWRDTNVYSVDEVKELLALAQDDGIGACRSQGFGTFDVIDLDIGKPAKRKKEKEAVAE